MLDVAMLKVQTTCKRSMAMKRREEPEKWIHKVFIRHQRLENYKATMQTFLAKFCSFPSSFIIILLLLYTILLLLQFLMKTLDSPQYAVMLFI